MMTDNELLLAISDLMEKKLESKLAPIRNDIKELKTSVKNLEIRMDRLESRMDSLEARMDSLEKCVTKLEIRVTGLEKRVTKLELHIENTTDKNIQLLVENYMPAAKKYETETAKIGSMQMDIEIMKDVIREHSERFELIS